MSLKDLERAFRRRYLSSGHRPFSGELVTEPRDALQLGPAPRILFLRQDRLGDLIISVPLIRAIRRHLPRAQLDLLLSRNNVAGRRAMDGYIDRIWKYNKSLPSALALFRNIRAQRYDLIVDLFDNPSATSQVVVRWGRARHALGIVHSRAGYYTVGVPLLDRSRVHVVDRIGQLMLPFGIDPATEPMDLEYRLSAEDIAQARSRLRKTDQPRRFGINISGSSIYKDWGVENFVAAVRHLQATRPDFAITISGSPQAAAEVHAIADATGAEALAPVSSFHEYAALIHEFDAMLTPDTSILHLAAAWKIPTVELFHQWEPDNLPWYPYHTPNRGLFHRDTVANIPLPAVLAALDDLLTEQFPPAAGGPH
ncbi:MAG: glycosyltransferase family 9 protein [Gemmatimonadota bacterium]